MYRRLRRFIFISSWKIDVRWMTVSPYQSSSSFLLHVVETNTTLIDGKRRIFSFIYGSLHSFQDEIFFNYVFQNYINSRNFRTIMWKMFLFKFECWLEFMNNFYRRAFNLNYIRTKTRPMWAKWNRRSYYLGEGKNISCYCTKFTLQNDTFPRLLFD